MFFSINPMFFKNIEVFTGKKQYKIRITLKYPSILQFIDFILIISFLPRTFLRKKIQPIVRTRYILLGLYLSAEG